MLPQTIRQMKLVHLLADKRKIMPLMSEAICLDAKSELTRRREFNQASPDQSCYETRARRSRPTICSTIDRKGQGLMYLFASALSSALEPRAI
jgi:hypothetical protein